MKPITLLIALSLLPSSSSAKGKPDAVIRMDFSNPAWTLDKAENYVKEFVNETTVMKPRIARVAEASRKMTAENEDLRDSVAEELTPAVLMDRIIKADAGERVGLLEKLPGMKPSPSETCKSLEFCNRVVTVMHVRDVQNVDQAVGALVRPWMLLQQARKQEFYMVRSSKKSKKPVLKLVLVGLPAASMEVRFSPTALGGMMLELNGRSDPEALFVAEKRKILSARM